MKQSVKKISKISTLLIGGLVCFLSGRIYGGMEANARYYNYYTCTEALLDTIYRHQQEYMDWLMESDAYYIYNQAKEKAKGE